MCILRQIKEQAAFFKTRILNLIIFEQILAQNTVIVLAKGGIESSFQATCRFTVEFEISVVGTCESGSQQTAAVSPPLNVDWAVAQHSVHWCSEWQGASLGTSKARDSSEEKSRQKSCSEKKKIEKSHSHFFLHSWHQEVLRPTVDKVRIEPTVVRHSNQNINLCSKVELG